MQTDFIASLIMDSAEKMIPAMFSLSEIACSTPLRIFQRENCFLFFSGWAFPPYFLELSLFPRSHCTVADAV